MDFGKERAFFGSVSLKSLIQVIGDSDVEAVVQGAENIVEVGGMPVRLPLAKLEVAQGTRPSAV